MLSNLEQTLKLPVFMFSHSKFTLERHGSAVQLSYWSGYEAFDYVVEMFVLRFNCTVGHRRADSSQFRLLAALSRSSSP